MSRRGSIVVECDSEDCYESVSYGPSAIEGELCDLLTSDGWRRKDDKDYCPACAVDENPRARDEDDGATYAHPGDRLKGID